MDSSERWDAETVGDALDVLQDLVLWELAPERWAQVDQLVARIGVAFAAGDDDELREAVAALELSGPVRATRIGANQVSGIPEPVLDRRNTLVHELGREQSKPPTTTEAGRGDQSAR